MRARACDVPTYLYYRGACVRARVYFSVAIFYVISFSQTTARPPWPGFLYVRYTNNVYENVFSGAA